MTKSKAELETDDCSGSHDPIWRVRALRLLEAEALGPLTWEGLLEWSKGGGLPQGMLRSTLAWLAVQHLGSYSSGLWKFSKFDASTPACRKCGGFVIQRVCRLCGDRDSTKDHVVLGEL